MHITSINTMKRHCSWLIHNFHWPSPVEVFVEPNRTIKVRKQSLCYFGRCLPTEIDGKVPDRGLPDGKSMFENLAERPDWTKIWFFTWFSVKTFHVVFNTYLSIGNIESTFPSISASQVTKFYHCNCLYQFLISQYRLYNIVYIV